MAGGTYRGSRLAAEECPTFVDNTTQVLFRGATITYVSDSLLQATRLEVCGLCLGAVHVSVAKRSKAIEVDVKFDEGLRVEGLPT